MDLRIKESNMEYVKVNGKEYPAQISGVMEDYAWDRRESKTITFESNVISYAQAVKTFVEGVAWSIISEWEEPVEGGEPIIHRDEFDNSDFSMAGEITDFRDGRVSVKMGKLTDLEQLIEDIYGE